MIGSRFYRATSAANNSPVSDNSACDRWIAILTSSCGVSESRPWPDNRMVEFNPFSPSSHWMQQLIVPAPPPHPAAGHQAIGGKQQPAILIEQADARGSVARRVHHVEAEVADVDQV